MQIIKRFFKFGFLIFPALASAQTTYLWQGARENHFIDRMEIRYPDSAAGIFTAIKPFSRKFAVQYGESFFNFSGSRGPFAQDNGQPVALSKSDAYNLQWLKGNSREWMHSEDVSLLSRKKIFGVFYQSKADFYEVNTGDFYLSVNPVLQLTGGAPKDSTGSLFLNSRGVAVRGRIANKIGFASIITENQERGPDFFRQQVKTLDAVPGAGFYKPFKKGAYDYFDARGYITFGAAKFIDFQFGYDKNFIGNGYRSLFLSDWGNSYLFFKMNTKIWKFNYQNLFMELMPQFHKQGRDTLLDRKYAAMHYLSLRATRWLTVGLFESVIFGRKNHFDFEYLNPIIFYRHIEGTIGSPDNAFAGLDFKANIKHRIQLYGQFMLDEFLLNKIKNDPKSWANKYGIQLGAKYIEAFGIKNLDLQLEWNRVRPFTYSHYDTIANYTHYNQPLAHPLGANFQELIGIVRYQPLPRLNFYARLIYYDKGLDSAGTNYGGNIFKNYITRSGETGFSVGSGLEQKCLNLFFNVSYEWRPNLYFELSLLHRKERLANGYQSDVNMISTGVRFNMFRREYDY